MKIKKDVLATAFSHEELRLRNHIFDLNQPFSIANGFFRVLANETSDVTDLVWHRFKLCDYVRVFFVAQTHYHAGHMLLAPFVRGPESCKPSFSV